MSKQTYKICLCFKRKFKHKEAHEVPDEIKALFEKFSENGVMNIDHFHKFLNEVQGEDEISREEAESLMDSFVHEYKHLNFFHHKSLRLFEFFRYLWNQSNSPLPYPPKVHHDMSAPLSHYFIYTGHNSYLTGNQISSDCSEVPIIEALKRGVRGIELDMWPNQKKDDIDIVHGGTLTAPVGLIKCLNAIKEHAFVASEYPVIITIEDHLTTDLQAKVATVVHETFGDTLICSKSDSISEFQSPEQFKGRIIISTKAPKEFLEAKDDGTIPGHKSSEEAAWGKEIQHFVEKKKLDDIKETDDHQDDNLDDLPQNAPTEYKHLITIPSMKMKEGIKEWLRVNSQTAHRVSLNEEKLEKAVLTHGHDILKFNQRNLMRVYPKATRIDSSNFNPLIGWMHGAQMVAFNMQRHGRSLWLMQGMFRANGGCGYVKKPEILVKSGVKGELFDPKRKLPVEKTLKVKIYMGEGWSSDFHRTHFDLYSPPDFYVKIGIAGVPDDSVMEKTKTIEDNWMPVWDEEFEFLLRVPELALLRIEVHEFDMSGKDDFGGQTCLPISELKTGIRAVPLHDQKGNMYTSVKLLLSFEFIEGSLIVID